MSFGISTFSSLFFLNRLIEQNNEEKARIFTDEIVENIQETLAESTAVSKSVNNSFVRELIADRDRFTDEQMSDILGTYLNDVTEQFGYDTAFIVTEYNRAYYTEWGLIKCLDSSNPDDDWYDNFAATGMKSELNIDNDQANGNRTTVYVNIRMEDENGSLIGICGVGHVLNSVNEMIDTLESVNELAIRLVSEDGIVQVAGDDSLCGQQASDITQIIINESKNNGGYYFEKSGTGGYRVAKFLNEYRWYLYVEHSSSNSEMTKILIQDLMACLIALTIMVGIISIAMKTQESETLSFKAESETDKMTGLLNRRAFDNELDEVRKSNRIKDFSLCVIDINGLKQVNDSIGHEAGDELIKGGAECISNVFAEHGKIYRIGGDEFALTTTEPVDSIEDSIQRLKNEVARWHGEMTKSLSLAIGFVRGKDHEELSVDELFKLADKEMYRDKEEYYKDKRHERRQR